MNNKNKTKKLLKYALCTALTVAVTATTMVLPQTYYKLIDGKNDSGSIIETFDSNIDVNSENAEEILDLYNLYDDIVLGSAAEAPETSADSDDGDIIRTTVLYTNADDDLANSDNDTDAGTVGASDLSDDGNTAESVDLYVSTDSVTSTDNATSLDEFLDFLTFGDYSGGDVQTVTVDDDSGAIIELPEPTQYDTGDADDDSADIDNTDNSSTDEKGTDDEEADSKNTNETNNDFTYKLLGSGKAEITGYTGSAADVEIPSNINGYTVTSIGKDAFYDCDSLINVTIPDSVTNIGEDAFSRCNNITSVAIPDSVTSIGEYAFLGCSELTSITIPDSVTSIGDNAFTGCSSLTDITVPTSVVDIGECVFQNCSSLTSINVADSNAHYTCEDGILFSKDKTELLSYPKGKTDASYTIPSEVTSIADDAFYNCDSLKNVDFSNVTDIGHSAFIFCDGLSDVKIGDKVTCIGAQAFSYCDNLTNVDISDSVITIKYYAFYDSNSLASIAIPDSVKEIEFCAFKSCDSLTSAVIGNGVTRIGEWAFESCSKLASVTIGNSVAEIGMEAFEDCSKLTSVTIPDSVTVIEEKAFCNCDILTIYGYSGSYAETYANDHSIPFLAKISTALTLEN